MTLEMKKLIKVYSIITGLCLILTVLFSVITNNKVGAFWFNVGFIISFLNILLLGGIIEFIIGEDNVKVIICFAIKIALTILLLFIAFKFSTFLSSIIFGVILALFLAMLALIITQRKDV